MYITRAALCAIAIVGITNIGVAQTPPHSTHNAKHGGEFFLAAGDTLHVEGVWPQQRVFKLYVYDAASLPLSRERMQRVRGRVNVGGQELPLILARDGSHLEARVPPLKIPADLTVTLTLPDTTGPEGFLFSFPAYSNEEAASFDIEPTVIPATLSGLLDALRRDADDAARLVGAGQTAFVFAPATRGRDHALALEAYLPRLPRDRRARADATIRVVVRTAWLLHIAGDDGTSAQVDVAAAAFQRAIGDAADVFAERGR